MSGNNYYKWIWMALVSIGILLCSNSCIYKTNKYHADWIVTQFEVGSIDKMNTIGIYNFTINTKTLTASPMGLYLEDSKYMQMDNTPLILSKIKGVTYIEFTKHPLFEGKYKIKCLDKECCELLITSENTFLKLVYNGDIPYGKSRNCP